MFKRLAAAFVCFLIPAFVLYAQAPQAIDSALADLSQRVGHPVALNDLQDWTFAQSNYPDASLGCPQPGVAYAQVLTSGVQFLLTYAGNVYDYRVSADRSTVILCGTNAAPTPNPSANCPPLGDAAYLPPRLTIGTNGMVIQGGLPNLVRTGPGQSGSALGQIPPGEEFKVLDGPRCSTLDKIVWWQVDYNGMVGWTAEGQAGTYWLQPMNLPAAGVTPASLLGQRITAENAAQLGLTTDFGKQTGVAALSPDGKLAVMGLTDGGLAIMNTQTGAQVATLNIGQLTAVVFGANGRLLATADQEGHVITWEIGRNGTVGSKDSLIVVWDSGDLGAIGGRAQFISSLGTKLTALAFSPDGLLLAGGDQNGAVYLWSYPTYTPPGYMEAPLVTLTGHTAAVTQLRFSSDGTRLFSMASDGSAAVWSLK